MVPGIVDGLLEEEMAPEDLSNCFQKKMNLKTLRCITAPSRILLQFISLRI